MNRTVLAIAMLLGTAAASAALCTPCTPLPSPAPGKPTSLAVHNGTMDAVKVYASFAADSAIDGDDWDFCEGDFSSCSFTVSGMSNTVMPDPHGKYLNVTLAFGEPVGCGVTKAEVNINNPDWYDILDVSLVDGFNRQVQITAESGDGSTATLGPAKNDAGDAQLNGVFPYGCDICVARQDPPCGIAKGYDGCKVGTQYDPKPPCQWQGKNKGGGDLAVVVSLVQ